MDEKFLQKMAQSLNESTKSLIPLYLEGRKNILDVGCADGSMIEKLLELDSDRTITGLEINEDYAKVCKDKGLDNIITESILQFKDIENYDAVLFSSVLHEVSSYHDTERFNWVPIYKALHKAYEVLQPGGLCIIRDGVAGNSFDDCYFKFRNIEDVKWIDKFKDTDVYRHLGTEIISGPDNYDTENAVYKSTQRVFKEFLMKYTWGENSWNRESKEIVGILTKVGWINIVNQVGFTIKMITTSSERYYEHLSKKIVCGQLENILSECTITMLLEKE